MHDPSTLALSIYGPLGLYRNWRRNYLRARDRNAEANAIPYPTALIDIWHVDPERDGSDDSCGFTYPALSGRERERIAKLAEGEFDFMFGKFDPLMRASCYEVLYAVWRRVAWDFDRRRSLTLVDLNEIGDLACNPDDNLRRYAHECRYDKEQNRLLWLYVLRCYRCVHRPWYRKPRWHIHHWRLKFPSLRQLKKHRTRRAVKS